MGEREGGREGGGKGISNVNPHKLKSMQKATPDAECRPDIATAVVTGYEKRKMPSKHYVSICVCMLMPVLVHGLLRRL